MKITLEELTVNELLKIAKVLTEEPVNSVEKIAPVALVHCEETDEECEATTLDKEGLPWDERIHSSN